MSRATRRQKAEHQLRLLEEQFTADLIVALRTCASTEWGMFSQNEFLKSKAADHILDLGDEIMRLRRELGVKDDFPLLQRYRFLGNRSEPLPFPISRKSGVPNSLVGW